MNSGIVGKFFKTLKKEMQAMSLIIRFTPSTSPDIVTNHLYIEEAPAEVTNNSPMHDVGNNIVNYEGQPKVEIDLSTIPGITNGVYNIGICAVDSDGNEAPMSLVNDVSVTLPANPPEPPIVEPPVGEVYLRFTPSSSLDVKTNFIFIESIPNPVTFNSLMFDIGNETFDYNGTPKVEVALSTIVKKDGTYNIGVLTVDTNGNKSKMMTLDNVVINLFPPEPISDLEVSDTSLK